MKILRKQIRKYLTIFVLSSSRKHKQNPHKVNFLRTNQRPEQLFQDDQTNTKTLAFVK